MKCGNVCCGENLEYITNGMSLLWLCSRVPFVCLSAVSVVGRLYTYGNVPIGQRVAPCEYNCSGGAG